MPLELPPAVAEFVQETAAAAPPMSDGLRDDLRLIIWGTPAAAVAGLGGAEAA